MPIVNCCCGSCCCCLPPVVIQANSEPSGTGTWDVEYTYQSTACLTICGARVSLHTYHHTAGTLPGYLFGIEDITLTYWCGIPNAICMSVDYPYISTDLFPPTSPYIILLDKVVATAADFIGAHQLDFYGAECACKVLVNGPRIQWRWEPATNTEHLTEPYKSQCPITVYSYRMTPCASGTAYDGFTNIELEEGSIWFDGINCYTATAQEPVEGAVPICDLIAATDCDSPPCFVECICEPVDGLYAYTLARCIDFPVEDFYALLPDCYANGTVLRESGTEFPRYILTCGPTTGMQTLVTFTVPEITICP